MFRRSALVTLLMVPILLLLGSPASAITGSKSISNSGASASYTWTWNPTSLAFMTVRVSDLACDNNSVYGQIILVYTNGSRSIYPHHNYNGCNSTRTWPGLGAGNGRPIAHVFIKACVDDFGYDTCATSGITRNPYV